jgi:hypothetical protein
MIPPLREIQTRHTDCVVMGCRKEVLSAIQDRAELKFTAIELANLVPEDQFKKYKNVFDAMPQGCPEYKKDVANFLNQLEWFAMNFRYHIADEQYIYQSLHQVYLQAVQYFYLDIAWVNLGPVVGPNKYFTNISVLYNQWHKKKAGALDAWNQKMSKATSRVDKLQQEYPQTPPLND